MEYYKNIYNKLPIKNNAYYDEKLTEDVIAEIIVAYKILESPGFFIKYINYLGRPLETGLEYLPKIAKKSISKITYLSLEKAMKIVTNSMKNIPNKKVSNWWHKGAVVCTGAVSGAVGLSALAFELPLTTTIILRSIADVARSQGADISKPEIQLACMEVFSLGASAKKTDELESVYLTTRISFAEVIMQSVKYLENGATQTIEKGSVPILIKFISQISEKFGIIVSEKMLAQMIPVIGAVSGATINTFFINYFQEMAKGHFIMKRLENKYGKIIWHEYEKIHSNSKSV